MGVGPLGVLLYEFTKFCAHLYRSADFSGRRTGPRMEARLASQPIQASLRGQDAVSEGIQLQRQGLHVKIVSSQMASSIRVLSVTRCHFLWGQGRGDGNPTKGWFDKLLLLRAKEILSTQRAGAGFCQTILTEAKPQTAG